jgi:hypothetical protein
MAQFTPDFQGTDPSTTLVRASPGPIRGRFSRNLFWRRQGTLAAKTAHWALNCLLFRIFRADKRDKRRRLLPL